jgi:transcriptional regulator with XRE-family HTH domain
MRRLMLDMSQEKLANALGVSFQQVQKYENGTNRIGASRLQQMSAVLQVPPAFFFEGLTAANPETQGGNGSASLDYATAFLATADGLALAKAFMQLESPQIRRRIVRLVQEIAANKADR